MPQNAYQERLLQAWNITEQDLALNRQGQASEHQKQLVQRTLKRDYHLALLAFFIALILCVPAIVEVLGEVRGGDLVASLESIVSVLVVSIPIMVTTAYLIATQRNQRASSDLPFRRIEGVATVIPVYGKRVYRRVRFGANETPYLEDARSDLFRHGGMYRVYTLGPEAIGIESLDTPADFVPPPTSIPTHKWIFSTIKVTILISAALAVALITYLTVDTYFPNPMTTSPTPIGTSLGKFTTDHTETVNGVTAQILRGEASGSGIIQRSSEGLSFVPEDPNFFPFPPGSSGYFFLRDDARLLTQVQPGERWLGILTLTQASFVYASPTPTAYATVSGAQGLQRLPEIE